MAETFKDVRSYDLVAYLLCKGFVYIDPPIIKRGQVVFTFKQTPELEENIRNYFKPDAVVNPLAFNLHLRAVNRLATAIRNASLGGEE